MLLIVCQIFVLLLLMFRNKTPLSQVGTVLYCSTSECVQGSKGEQGGGTAAAAPPENVVTNENVFDVNNM